MANSKHDFDNLSNLSGLVSAIPGRNTLQLRNMHDSTTRQPFLANTLCSSQPKSLEHIDQDACSINPIRYILNRNDTSQTFNLNEISLHEMSANAPMSPTSFTSLLLKPKQETSVKHGMKRQASLTSERGQQTTMWNQIENFLPDDLVSESRNRKDDFSSPFTKQTQGLFGTPQNLKRAAESSMQLFSKFERSLDASDHDRSYCLKSGLNHFGPSGTKSSGSTTSSNAAAPQVAQKLLKKPECRAEANFPETGRQRMDAQAYEEWSLKKVKAIEDEMKTLTSKKDPRWTQLRKQKTAQLHRMKKKISIKQQKSKLQIMDDVIEFLISQTECQLTGQRRVLFKAAMQQALPMQASKVMLNPLTRDAQK